MPKHPPNPSTNRNYANIHAQRNGFGESYSIARSPTDLLPLLHTISGGLPALSMMCPAMGIRQQRAVAA
jgi:hypothetical protein